MLRNISVSMAQKYLQKNVRFFVNTAIGPYSQSLLANSNIVLWLMFLNVLNNKTSRSIYNLLNIFGIINNLDTQLLICAIKNLLGRLCEYGPRSCFSYQDNFDSPTVSINGHFVWLSR